MLKLFNSNGVGSWLSSWTEGWIENDSRCVCVLPAELLLFPIDSVSLLSSQNSVCRLCSTQYSPSQSLKQADTGEHHTHLESLNADSRCVSTFRNKPVSCRSSWKNLWLKMNATPLISSTLASAVVFLFLKFAVMAMASFPLNSLRLKPVHTHGYRTTWSGTQCPHFRKGVSNST